MATVAKTMETTKQFFKNPPKDPLRRQIQFKPKKRVRYYLVSVSKTDPMVGAAKTEVNQVLCSPLIVSTRRVEPITSKAMISNEDSVLANSRSKEGSQNHISPRGVVFQEHSPYLSRTPFMRGVREMNLSC